MPKLVPDSEHGSVSMMLPMANLGAKTLFVAGHECGAPFSQRSRNHEELERYGFASMRRRRRPISSSSAQQEPVRYHLRHRFWCKIDTPSKVCTCRLVNLSQPADTWVRINGTSESINREVSFAKVATINGGVEIGSIIRDCLVLQKEVFEDERKRDFTLMFPVLNTPWNQGNGKKVYLCIDESSSKSKASGEVEQPEVQITGVPLASSSRNSSAVPRSRQYSVGGRADTLVLKNTSMHPDPKLPLVGGGSSGNASQVGSSAFATREPSPFVVGPESGLEIPSLASKTIIPAPATSLSHHSITTENNLNDHSENPVDSAPAASDAVPAIIADQESKLEDDEILAAKTSIAQEASSVSFAPHEQSKAASLRTTSSLSVSRLEAVKMHYGEGRSKAFFGLEKIKTKKTGKLQPNPPATNQPFLKAKRKRYGWHPKMSPDEDTKGISHITSSGTVRDRPLFPPQHRFSKLSQQYFYPQKPKHTDFELVDMIENMAIQDDLVFTEEPENEREIEAFHPPSMSEYSRHSTPATGSKQYRPSIAESEGSLKSDHSHQSRQSRLSFLRKK
eukprot:jgi/Hompol1/1939/HPOL_001411-RA